jgi:hypothetical protein
MEAKTVHHVRLADIKISFLPEEFPKIWEAIKRHQLQTVKLHGPNPLMPICVDPVYDQADGSLVEYIGLSNTFYVYALKVIFGPDFKITVVEIHDMDQHDYYMVTHMVQSESDLQIELHRSDERRGRI